MSNANVDLPEPDTPVTTLNLPRGMSTESDLRLCSFALTMRMALEVSMPKASPPPEADGLAPRADLLLAKRVDEALGASPSAAASEEYTADDSATSCTTPIAAAYSRSALPVWDVACNSKSSGVP